jgi:hypothetical protein
LGKFFLEILYWLYKAAYAISPNFRLNGSRPPQVSAVRMAVTSLLFHLHTFFLFTKSDLKTLIPPVVRFALLVSLLYCLANTTLYYRIRHFSLQSSLRHPVSFVFSTPFFGCGSILCSLDSQTRRFHARSQKTALTTPTVLFRPDALLSGKHALYAG